MKYLSAKPPALVTRYGTGTYIGAAIVIEGGQPSIAFDPEAIVEIPNAEFEKYSREYLTHLRDGALTVRDEAAFHAYQRKEALESAAQAEPASADDAPPESDAAPDEPSTQQLEK